MKQLSTETFDQNAIAALQDKQLNGALRNLANTIGEKRRIALGSVENWEELRETARSVKEETLKNLDRYLSDFADNAVKAGAQVHWAQDAAEANEIVLKLVKERGATEVVKAKSMVTEEIHLNSALEKEGIEPIETDLGEWIIQLAKETPSHIVVPAIHKTKQQIADLFVEKVGIEPTDDVDVLTKTARDILRSRFAAASIGISGANFAVAETGTILLLENEGNIRLTTSLPKTHIAVVGIEKVIPKLSDLDVFLKLLPRSGTGQKLTTYQSLITGTKRGEFAEGPEELHIVLLDNGRSGMLAHPVTRQSLACIRCGACLNVCPVYQQVGGHAYGSVYPGPIGAVITPQLQGIEKSKHLPFASSLCGACREVCPVKIDIPELLLHLRAKITAESEHPKRLEKLAFKIQSRVWSSETLYKFGNKIARIFQRFSAFAPPIRAWKKSREVPVIAPKSFREMWKDKEEKKLDQG